MIKIVKGAAGNWLTIGNNSMMVGSLHDAKMIVAAFEKVKSDAHAAGMAKGAQNLKDEFRDRLHKLEVGGISGGTINDVNERLLALRFKSVVDGLIRDIDVNTITERE